MSEALSDILSQALRRGELAQVHKVDASWFSGVVVSSEGCEAAAGVALALAGYLPSGDPFVVVLSFERPQLAALLDSIIAATIAATFEPGDPHVVTRTMGGNDE